MHNSSSLILTGARRCGEIKSRIGALWRPLSLIPFSVISSQPVTLGDEILALLSGAVVIIVGAGGESTQFTDEQGRTLLTKRDIPDGNGGTKTIRVTNPDPSSRIPNLMSVPIGS